MKEIESIREAYHNTINLYKISDKHKEHLHLLTDGLIADLKPYLQEDVRENRTTELFTELGKHIFENLELLDGRIVEPDTYDDLKPNFNKALEIVDKISELENG